MQVSVEATEGLERRLSVEVPAEQVDGEVQKRLKNMAGRVRLDGFRPGKVPMKVLQSRFGEQVRHEVVGDLMQSSFYEAVTQEKLRPAGRPAIEPTSLESGKSLAYVATFEVYPEVTLAPMADLQVERPVTTINDADVDEMIETLRKQRITWNPVDRPAALGDQVTIDFEGTIEGEAFAGNKGDGVALELGHNRFIPGFEDALVGATAGEARTLDLQFPEDYHAKDLAGKPVRFETKVSAVAEAQLPEVDEAFAEAFGVKEGGVESLRQQVRENMQRELDQTVKSVIKNQVMDALMTANPISVPNALIVDEIDRLREQARMQFGGNKEVKLPDELFRDQAQRRVTLGLLLAEVIQANEMKVEPERLRQTVESIASAYEDPEQVVKWYYSRKDQMAELESVVLEEQVVDWVLGQAQVTDKETAFNELMKTGQGS